MKTKRLAQTVLAVVLVAAALVANGKGGGEGGGRGKGRANPPNLGWRGANTTVEALSADWWQWALNIPAPENPINDPDGGFCDIGQQGKVWYLAGTGGGDPEDPPVVRTCTIPAGKALFFPIVNYAYVSYPPWYPYDPDNPDEWPGPDPSFDDPAPYTSDWAGEFANYFAYVSFILDMFMGSIGDLYCEIDGEPVEDLFEYIGQSPVFGAVLPEDNILGEPAGLYDECIGTGVFLMLEPLDPGEHTIEFGGTMWGGGMAVDVVYDLTVVGKKGKKK